MTNTVRSFQIALIDTTDGSTIQESEFLGENPMHAAYMAGINVGLNMASNPLVQMFGGSFLSSQLSRVLRERDITILRDNGVITDAQVDEYLYSTDDVEPNKGEGGVDPSEDFDLEAFLQQIINEIDDDSL